MVTQLVFRTLFVLLFIDLHYGFAQFAKNQSARGLGARTRFVGVMTVPTGRAGAVNPLRVELKEWMLNKSEQGLEIPITSFYIAHLRSGVMTTQIAGQSVTRRAGDFWAVQPNTAMSVVIKAPQQLTILETLAVTLGH